MINIILGCINLSIMALIIGSISRLNPQLKMLNQPFVLESIKHQKTLLGKLKARYPLDIMYGQKRSDKMIVSYFLYYLFFVSVIIGTRPITVIVKAILIAILVSIPFIVMEIWRQRCIHSIDQEMLNFLQTLSLNFQIEEDVLKALDKTQSLTTNPYIKRLLMRFNLHVKKGLSVEQAFIYLQKDALHTYLNYIFVNLEETYSRRGDVLKLITHIELEYTAIQIEINKRRIELKQERVMMAIMLVVLTLIGYAVFQSHDYLRDFYVKYQWIDEIVLIWLTTLIVSILVYMKGHNVDY